MGTTGSVSIILRYAREKMAEEVVAEAEVVMAAEEEIREVVVVVVMEEAEGEATVVDVDGLDDLTRLEWQARRPGERPRKYLNIFRLFLLAALLSSLLFF